MESITSFAGVAEATEKLSLEEQESLLELLQR